MKQLVKETKFLQEWTPGQFKGMEHAIAAHFSGKPMETNRGKYPAMYLGWNAINDRLGLAYTSSSNYAGYWACNEDAINKDYPDYRYIGFAISKGGKYCAILWDKDENEVIISL